MSEFHYPDTPGADAEIRQLTSKLGLECVRFYSHLSPSDKHSEESLKYAWLLPQINALDSCHIVVAMGGRHDGSAALLLRVAESRHKPILPIRFIGGTAARMYERLQYELQDKLSDDLSILNDAGRIDELSGLIDKLAASSLDIPDKDKSLEFFISYPSRNTIEKTELHCLPRRKRFRGGNENIRRNSTVHLPRERIHCSLVQ